MEHVDMTHDPAEIVQADEPTLPMQPIPVGVTGVVDTREMPGRLPGYRTEPGVTSSFGVRLLTLEPRRKETIIIPVTTDVWLSATQAGAQVGSAGSIRVPVGAMFPVRHIEEVWACSTGAATDISIATVFWSE